MKLQELHEGAQDLPAKIMKALAGIKGTKVQVTAVKQPLQDVDGEDYPEAYRVVVTYTPTRGVKPVGVKHVYRLQDGDWGYRSDATSFERTDLDEVLDELRQEVVQSQKFHGGSKSVDESVGSKLFKAFWETTPKEIMRRQQELSDDEVKLLWSQGEDAPKGSPRAIQLRALASEIKRRGLKVAEGALVEGYETKVLKAAEADGVRGCFFKGGKLFCDKPDFDRVVKLLKKAEAKGEFDMPEVVAIED